MLSSLRCSIRSAIVVCVTDGLKQLSKTIIRVARRRSESHIVVVVVEERN